MRKKTRFAICMIIIISTLSVSLYGCSGTTKEVMYPTKPINVIVPWSAGGSTDMVARVAAGQLSSKLGATINVVDQPGGQGIPGTIEALGSAADGYTLLADADGSNAIVAAWGTDVPFDISERTYIAKIAEFPWVFFIRYDLNWETLDDVAEAIKSNPEDVKWGWLGGTAGADGPVAQYMAALKSKGVDVSKLKMVTFKGGSDLATAVAGGHVDIGVASTTAVGSVFSAGKVKLIGITSQDRFSGYPDVKTTIEQGWNTVTFRGHVGYAGPKGMPSEAVKVLEDGLKDVLATPEAKAELDKIGATPAFMGSQDYREYVLKLADELKAIKIE